MIARYCIAALALLASSVSANPFAAKTSDNSAKAAYMSKLVRAGRRLDGYYAADVEVDLSGFSLRFEKCQFVKSYSGDYAEEDYDTVLQTNRFVIFRLCPSSSCGSCSNGYGEYVVDMATYLDATVEYYKEEQEEMCDTCMEECYYEQGDDAGEEEEEAGDDAARRKLASVDCSTCVSECEKIENMEDNYYVDATTMIGCQQVQNADDDGNGALFGGPICASNGSKIKIGVFLDENCNFLDSSLDVESYLTNENGQGMKLSHALLKKTYDTSSCIACATEVEAEDDGAAVEYEANELCMEMYEDAGKCESKHGMAYGMSYANSNDGEFANQLANEELVCDFISSLKSGTYSQDGDIVIGGNKIYASGGTATTGGQKFALTFFIIGTVGLAVYAAMLHSQLTKGGKADLSAQGGAMA